MTFPRVFALALAGAVVAAPLTAQGIPSGGRISATPRTVPHMLVGTPYVNATADSAAAVTVGRSLRRQMDKETSRDYAVISDSTMSAALVQFGYGPYAILPPNLQRQLAQQLGARFLVTATLTKGENGSAGYDLTARLSGINDDAGQVVTVSQKPNQSLPELGQQGAQALEPVLGVLDDARQCMDYYGQKKYDKARDAAQKVLKKVPDEGLANYCLALIADTTSAPRDSVINLLRAAVHGDPLSLKGWSQLAIRYQQAADTANTVKAFQQILRVAPTNQTLRDQAFRLFLNYGQPKAAEEVADEGLRIDPYNADLYDLKSNACLFQSDFQCAIGALAQEYTVDSTKADTLFFAKILVAADQQPDTAQLLKWSRIGVNKYPTNVTLLGYLNQAYALTGMTDSSLAITRKLMSMDTTATGPALAAIQALGSAHRVAEIQPFLTFVQQHGSADDQQKAALILVNSSLAVLQDSTKDYKTAAQLARQGVALAPDTTGQVGMNANYILGLATFLQGAALDSSVVAQKSCDLAKQEESLFTEAKGALTKGRAAKPDAVDQYLGYIEKYKPRVASLKKAYCK